MRLTQYVQASVILSLITDVTCFMVGSSEGFSKCYYSDVSHDKTLQVKFGFPRTQKHNCVFRLKIDYQIEKNSPQQSKQRNISLYSGQFICYQMSPRQLFVYKHTPSEDQYSGFYKICVQNIEDNNTRESSIANSTLFELQISEKYDPSLMMSMIDGDIPLVGSNDLMQMQSVVTTIKRSLGWCRVHIKHAQSVNILFDRAVQQLANSNGNATIFQIIFLISYGIVWIAVFYSALK